MLYFNVSAALEKNLLGSKQHCVGLGHVIFDQPVDIFSSDVTRALSLSGKT